MPQVPVTENAHLTGGEVEEIPGTTERKEKHLGVGGAPSLPRKFPSTQTQGLAFLHE